jgi:hypothetical protein
MEERKNFNDGIAMSIDLTLFNKKINDPTKLEAMRRLSDVTVFTNICALKIIDRKNFTEQIVIRVCETMKNQDRLLLLNLDFCIYISILII